jgi:sensor c-di-GMP phosphodiesterase-like protein
VQAIVDSTIALAHDLGMAVVAEGVETGEVEGRLQALRCDVGQGWLYARALPLEAFVAWGQVRRADA